MPESSRTREVFRQLATARDRLRADDERLVAEQVRLAEVPAPTGEEGPRGAFVAARLGSMLRRVECDVAGNVLAWIPGRRDVAPIVVCAHLDTVFASDTPLSVRRVGARLRGPGISDNARGLAAMLAIAGALGGAGRTERPILLAATTGEEGDGDLRGARHLFDAAARGAHAAIALDGAGDDRIVTHALGCVRLRVVVRGPGGHSWAAFGAPNPVHVVGALVARIAALQLPQAPRSTLTVSRIGGGSAVNAIPRDAWIDVDMRSTSEVELRRLATAVERHAEDAVLVENLARANGSDELQLSIERIGDRPAGVVSEQHELVRTARDATAAIGRRPQLAVASTDANIPISLGIPAIAIGAGGTAGLTHTPDEWFDPADGHLGVARALTIVVAAADIV